MDKKIAKFVDSLVNNGVPRMQAIALALSVEHSLMNKDFAVQYGTIMVDALKEFLDQVDA